MTAPRRRRGSRGPARAVPLTLTLTLTLALAACVGESEGTGHEAQTAAAPATSTATAAPGAGPADEPEPLPYEADQPLSPDVTDAGAAFLIATGRLPVGHSGGAFGVMLRSLTTRPAPDVLLLGDSMAQQGIDPAVLGELLSERAGEEVTVFNAASGRARWGVNRLVVETMLDQDLVPEVAVLVISTRAAEGDLYYRGTVQHRSISHVVQGCDREPGNSWTEEDEEACRRSLASPRARFATAGGEVEWVRSGHELPTSAEIRPGIFLRADGYLDHPSISLAEHEEQSRERIARGFPGWPGIQDEAVEDVGEIARQLRERGVHVLSVEIPYPTQHQDNLEEAWPRYDERRQKAAAALAASADLPHFPVASFGDWMSDGDVRDTIHLSGRGGPKFARQLVEDLPGFADEILSGIDGDDEAPGTD